jgi:titin
VGYAQRFYVPNYSSGQLELFSATGQPQKAIDVPDADGKFELRIDGGYLWANAAKSRNALVIGPDGQLREVDKYDKEAPGPAPKPKKEPGKTEAPLPPPGPKPGGSTPVPKAPLAPVTTTTTQPSVAPAAATRPDPPTNADALPSSKEVLVSWQMPVNDGGSPVTGYRVTWKPTKAGDTKATSGQVELTKPDLSKVVGALHNGSRYEFKVAAKNAVGWSDPSAPVSATPSSEITSPPIDVAVSQTKANNDGSINVSWAEGEDQGHEVGSFQVFATPATGGSPQPVATANGPCGGSCSVQVPAQQGAWLGTAQQFTVVADATADGGNASDPSDPSDPITPATAPDAPTVTLQNESADGKTLTIAVSVPFDGGHAVTSALIDGATQSCASTGCTVTATVPDRSAAHDVNISLINDMGTGPGAPVSAAAKAAPSGSISGSANGYNVGHLDWSSSGDGVTCTVSGPGFSSSSCSGSQNFSIGAGTYSYTLTVSSPYYPSVSYPSNSFTVANPPPPKTVTVSKGAPKTVSGCSTSACRFVTVSVANMSPTYNVQCYSSKDSQPYYSYTTSSATSNVCVFGFPGSTVWAVVNGVESPHINW